MDSKQREKQGGYWTERVTLPSGGLESELNYYEFKKDNASQVQEMEGGELDYANWN